MIAVQLVGIAVAAAAAAAAGAGDGAAEIQEIAFGAGKVLALTRLWLATRLLPAT